MKNKISFSIQLPLQKKKKKRKKAIQFSSEPTIQFPFFSAVRCTICLLLQTAEGCHSCITMKLSNIGAEQERIYTYLAKIRRLLPDAVGNSDARDDLLPVLLFPCFFFFCCCHLIMKKLAICSLIATWFWINFVQKQRHPIQSTYSSVPTFAFFFSEELCYLPLQLQISFSLY